MIRRYELLNFKLSSFPNKGAVRAGTRIRCEIPITLTSVDPAHPFSEPCLIILVNPQGCAARFRRPLEIGAAVQLEGLPAGTRVTARVVNCILIGEYEKLWLLGLALDEPGNVWGGQRWKSWQNRTVERCLLPRTKKRTQRPSSPKANGIVAVHLSCQRDTGNRWRRAGSVKRVGYNKRRKETGKCLACGEELPQEEVEKIRQWQVEEWIDGDHG